MSTVVRLKPSTPSTSAKPKSKRAAKALRRQAISALGVGVIATTLTALSLTHLAHGIEIVTHASTWESDATERVNDSETVQF
jgi:hypothetical protein